MLEEKAVTHANIFENCIILFYHVSEIDECSYINITLPAKHQHSANV